MKSRAFYPSCFRNKKLTSFTFHIYTEHSWAATNLLPALRQNSPYAPYAPCSIWAATNLLPALRQNSPYAPYAYAPTCRILRRKVGKMRFRFSVLKTPPGYCTCRRSAWIDVLWFLLFCTHRRNAWTLSERESDSTKSKLYSKNSADSYKNCFVS